VEACAVLASGHRAHRGPRRRDERDGEAAFLGIASIGFDSEVQERVLTTRLPLGQLVYAYGSLVTVARWQPAAFSGTVDGEPLALSGWSVAVSNSGRYGGGMRLAPRASMTDGLLDVVTTSATSRLRFLRSLPTVFRGTHVRQASVVVRPGRTVVLSADRPFRVFADGDPVGTLPATVRVRPAAVRVLLPARP
jgi:diacylglycerol kinase family enzyme